MENQTQKETVKAILDLLGYIQEKAKNSENTEVLPETVKATCDMIKMAKDYCWI